MADLDEESDQRDPSEDDRPSPSARPFGAAWGEAAPSPSARTLGDALHDLTRAPPPPPSPSPSPSLLARIASTALAPTPEEIARRTRMEAEAEEAEEAEERRAREATEAERDPARCTLHVVAIGPLPPRPPELASGEDGPGDGAAAGRALDRAFPGGVHVVEGIPHRQGAHCPTRECVTRAAQGLASGRAAALALVLERHPDRTADALRARCLLGCTPEAIGAALAAAIAHEEEALARVVREERAREMAAEEDAFFAEATRITTTERPAPRLVEGILPESSLVWIVGASGSRKTVTSMSLGVACAAGVPWLGRDVTRCRVAGVWLEGADEEINGRLHQLALGAGTSLEALGERERQMLRYRRRLRTADEASVRAYVEWLRRARPAWVAVDNLSELGDITWSDPASIKRHVEPLALIAHGKLVHDLPPITHVLLHHTSASGEERGGEAARQDADLIFRISADSDAPDAPIHLTRGKCRNPRATAEKVSLRLVDRADGAIVLESIDRERPAGGRPAPAHPDHERREQMLALLRDEPRRATDLYRAMDCSRDVVLRVRGGLKRDELIEEREGRWALVE